MKSGDTGPDKLNISFVGDLMCLKNEKMVMPNAQMLKIFEQSDLVVINLEAPIVRDYVEKGNNLVVFSFSSEFIKNFLEVFKLPAEKVIFSIANNHMGDDGKKGYVETIKRLEELKIKWVGGLSTIKAVLTIYKKNTHVGFMAYSQWLNHKVFDETLGICRYHHVENIDFQKIKIEYELDALILLPHWGLEFRHFPSAGLVQTAKDFMAKGVDLIAGHHPHVLGPIEKINHGLCHYSLGNFFSKTLHDVTHLTGVWTVSIDATKNAEKKFAYKLHPFFMTSQYQFETIDRLPEKLKSKLQKRLSLIYPESDG